MFCVDNVFIFFGLKVNYLYVKFLVELVWWLNWIVCIKVYFLFYMKRVLFWDLCISCRLYNWYFFFFELFFVFVIVFNLIFIEILIGVGFLGNMMDMIIFMIWNVSKCILIFLVGSGYYFVFVVKVEKGGEYVMWLGMNWVYCEF